MPLSTALRLALLTVMTPLVPLATLVMAGPAQAATCTGTLQVQLMAGLARDSVVAPPEGYGYATQPLADLTARTTSELAVAVTRDAGCAVPGAQVKLYAKDAGAPSFVLRRTATTDSGGGSDFSVTPPHTTDLQATASLGQETARSTVLRRTVRVNVSAAFSSPGRCQLRITGATYPAKPHHPVWMQRRITSGGVEKGYLTVQRSYTDAQGRYDVTYTGRCGATYAIAPYVAASATNAAARSLYVALNVKAKR